MPSDLTIRNTPALNLTGLNSGVPVASRYVGAHAGGPPTTGSFLAGDWIIDTTYQLIWICSASGTPGTWNFGQASGYVNGNGAIADQGSITTEVAMTNMGFTQITHSFRNYELRAGGFGCQSTVSTDTYQVNIYQAGVVIGQCRGNCNAPTNWATPPLFFTGTDNNDSYTCKVQRVAGSGTLTHLGGTTHPAVIRLMDVGPA